MEINTRAANSDLLIYVNLTSPWTEATTAAVGLCDAKSFGPHNPGTIRASESYMEPEQRSTTAWCAWVDSQPARQRVHDRDNREQLNVRDELAFLAKNEDDWSPRDSSPRRPSTRHSTPCPKGAAACSRRCPRPMASRASSLRQAAHAKTPMCSSSTRCRSMGRRTSWSRVLHISYNVNAYLNPLLVSVLIQGTCST